MSTDVDGLREAMREAAVRGGPVTDPWQRYTAVAARRSRRRRVRGAAAATVVAAAVAVALGAGAVGVPPSWVPSLVADPAGSESAFLNGPAVGSLADDRDWIEDFLRAYRSSRLLRETPGSADEHRRGRAHIRYAGDVGESRVVAVLTDNGVSWAEGPRGAQPEQMQSDGERYGPLPDALTYVVGEVAPKTLLMVAPDGASVDVTQQIARFGADGRAPRPTQRGVRVVGGEATYRLDDAVAGISVRVTLDGEVLYDGFVSESVGLAGMPYVPEPSALRGTTAQTRGDVPVDLEFLWSVLDGAAGMERVPLRGADIRVIWSGTLQGQEAMLVTIQPPGGGVLAYAYRITDREDGRVSGGMQDLTLLLPAEGAYTRPIAWRLRGGGPSGDDLTDTVAVVAPPGTVRAELITDDGQVSAVPLDGAGFGVVQLPPDGGATARAFTAQGGLLGQTPVRSTPGQSELPGTSPATRVVD